MTVLGAWVDAYLMLGVNLEQISTTY